MTNEELLSVAEIVEKLTDRFNAQAALHRERHNEYDKLIASMNDDHEAKMVEHRAAFGALAEADAKIIAGLRSEIGAARMAVLERDSLISERAKLQAMVKEQSDSAKAAGELLGWTANESPIQAVERVVRERDGLLTQVQDMRAEMERLQWENATMQKDAEDGYAEAIKVLGDPIALSKERDALRAEVARLKSQTPKHPVKVGEWVRRSKLPGDQSPVGIVKQVTSIRCDGDSYGFADGDFWSVDNCEPCSRQHPAQDGQWVRRTVASGTEPVGTMIQVQRSRTLHSEYVTRGAQVVPWAHCEPCDPPQTEPVPKLTHPAAVGGYLRRLTGFNTTPAGEVARVTLVDDDEPSQVEYEVVRPNGEKGRWSAKGCEPCDPPEADHDTVQGKATAEAALKTEPVAEEIKVGDLGEVFQATTRTLNSDVGITGRVSSVYLDPRHGGFLVTFDPSTQSRRSAGMQAFGLCDVRKVTT